MKYVYLLIAIIAEVIATSALKASNQFTKWVLGVITLVGYGVAFYFLSLTLRSMPIGIVYASWSGAGIVLVALVGIVLFKQIPDLPAIVGMALIITGVLVMNLLSKTTGH